MGTCRIGRYSIRFHLGQEPRGRSPLPARSDGGDRGVESDFVRGKTFPPHFRQQVHHPGPLAAPAGDVGVEG